MEKLKFTKIDKILFQQKFKTGMKLLVVPVVQAKQVKFGIYVSKGGTSKDFFINKQKIYPGTLTMLVSGLCKYHPSSADCLFDGECKFESKVYESYTSFEVTCEISQAGKYMQALLSLLDKFEITNDQFEELKKEVISKIEEKNKNVDEQLRSYLYYSSPMKESPLGNKESIKLVHLPAAKKVFNTFFNPQFMTMFVVGNISPTDIANLIEAHKFPNRGEYEEPIYKPSKENYQSVPSYLGYTNLTDSLVLGVKFPSRKSLFEKYNGENFYYYFLIQHLIFSEVTNLVKTNCPALFALKESGLHEGLEDAYFYQIFQTGTPEVLQEQIEKFLSNPTPISKWDFYKAKKALLKKFTNLYKADIDLLYSRMLSSFANGKADMLVVELACKSSYKKFMAFYSDFIKFPRIYLISKK